MIFMDKPDQNQFFEQLLYFLQNGSAKINGRFPLTSNESQVRMQSLGVQTVIVIADEKNIEACWNVPILKQTFWYWFKLSGLVMNNRGKILVDCWPIPHGDTISYVKIAQSASGHGARYISITSSPNCYNQPHLKNIQNSFWLQPKPQSVLDILKR